MALQRHLAEGKVGAAGGPLGGSRESEAPTPGPCPSDGLGRAGVDTRRQQPGEGLRPQRQASLSLLWGLSPCLGSGVPPLPAQNGSEFG